jgi:putative two-component system response regulator
VETRDVAIFAMARLAESRDPETGAHLERVRSYCRILAQHLATTGATKDQVNAEYIRLIYQTSPLHDIGKVGIPDSVLLKPGRLSDREFEIMKTHTEIGAQTLDAALRQFPGIKFLEMSRDIAATHHERLDGSGYPRGLAGEEIPLCGRIVALADVYDALTSKRVYKNAFAHDVAKSIICADTGKQFDPIVVEAFCSTEPQFIAVRDRYSEARAAA